MAKKKKKNTKKTSANIGFEAKLWDMAHQLRGNLEPAVYKHDVLGLIFIKYISDRFSTHQAKLADTDGADPEDRDEYTADNVFWVPKGSRWGEIQKQARQDNIGVILDTAMNAIEKENDSLRGVLHKNYARPEIDKRKLGELIDVFSAIDLVGEQKSTEDLLGRVYEYFVGRFASAEGKSGGEFYTPQCVVRLLVSMLQPDDGDRIYDPCCGSGGMFVQSEWFIENHGGRRGKAALYGQESNHTTWKLCRMNLAIRGLDGDIEEGDTFHADKHPDLKADIVLANPPFNISKWGGELLHDDVRWRLGTPRNSNANYAWMQHILHHLAPSGKAGFVLANGSLSSNQGNDAQIRSALVQKGLLDCVVYLPTQLFYTTQISVSLWFLNRNKLSSADHPRKDETLFIYAYDMGEMVDRTHRELTSVDISRITETYHRWLGILDGSEYEDVPGFCYSATQKNIHEHAHAFVPGRYVGFSQEKSVPPRMDLLRKEFDKIKTRVCTSEKVSENATEVIRKILDV